VTERASGLAASTPTASPQASARASRAPTLIAVAVALFACLSLAAATTGPWQGVVAGLQAALIPEGAAQGALRGLVVSVSIGLLLLSRGLARRQHRAWAASTVLSAAAAALFLLRDIDLPTAFVAGLLAVVLWHWRSEFYAAASARRPIRAVATAAAALAIVFGYGVAALIWQATTAHLSWSWTGATSQAGWGMIGQDVVVPSSEFSRGLVATLTVGSVLILAALAWALLRPPRGGVTSSDREWREAKRLVATAGSDSLAYFALRRDKRYFFDEGHTAFLAYRAVAGIALVSGDPVGDPTGVPGLLGQFTAYCRRQAWHVAAIGVGAEMRARWEEVGLKTIYVGDEAIVRPSSFSLEGRAVRKLRQSVSRLERLGYRVEMRRAGELDSATLAAVVEVSEIWRGGQPERGFSMALDDVRSPDLDDTLFVLGHGPDDRLAGFLHFVPVPATGDLSLSGMRRLPDTPNGLNEYLVSSLLSWARERGVERVSLNFAVFGSLLRDEGSGPATRVTRGALRYTDRFFQVERLLNFNRKFEPDWVPRYLAVESRADVPAVGLVVLHLENLLPRGRGADKTPGGPPTSRAVSSEQTSAGTVVGGPEEPETGAH
jgi:lysyl-tRNA synthetase, class II